MELTYGHCIQSLLAKRVKLPYTDDDRACYSAKPPTTGFHRCQKGIPFLLGSQRTLPIPTIKLAKNVSNFSYAHSNATLASCTIPAKSMRPCHLTNISGIAQVKQQKFILMLLRPLSIR
jgi:hypothetical protein